MDDCCPLRRLSVSLECHRPSSIVCNVRLKTQVPASPQEPSGGQHVWPRSVPEGHLAVCRVSPQPRAEKLRLEHEQEREQGRAGTGYELGHPSLQPSWFGCHSGCLAGEESEREITNDPLAPLPPLSPSLLPSSPSPVSADSLPIASLLTSTVRAEEWQLSQVWTRPLPFWRSQEQEINRCRNRDAIRRISCRKCNPIFHFPRSTNTPSGSALPAQAC